MSSVPSTEVTAMRCGYEVGFLDVDCIMRWADNLIGRLSQPPIELIDLAMCRNVPSERITASLDRLDNADESFAVATTLGFVGLSHRCDEMATSDAVLRIFSCKDQAGISPDERDEMYYLDDALDLANAGTYGSIDDVRQAVDVFLAPYVRRIESNFPDLLTLRRAGMA